MNYELVHVEEKTVAGLRIRTSNSDPKMSRSIGELWQRFYQEGIYHSIPGKRNDKSIGLYTNYEMEVNGPYDVIVCCEIESPDRLLSSQRPAAQHLTEQGTGQGAGQASEQATVPATGQGTEQATVQGAEQGLGQPPVAQSSAEIQIETIPAGKYAKFIVQGHMQQAVAEFWTKLWSMELDRKFSSDFEEYQSGGDMDNAEIHIYIALN